MASQAGDRVEWALVLAFSDRCGESARGHNHCWNLGVKKASGQRLSSVHLAMQPLGVRAGVGVKVGVGELESPDTGAWSQPWA